MADGKAKKVQLDKFCMRQDKRHPAHTPLFTRHTRTHHPCESTTLVRSGTAMTRDTACDTANPRHHICHSSHTIQRNTHLRLGNARLHSFSFVSVSRLAVGEHMRVGGAGGPATHEARLQKVIPCALTAPNSHPCHTSCSNTGTLNQGHVGDEPWALHPISFLSTSKHPWTLRQLVCL